jgi:glycerol kinase
VHILSLDQGTTSSRSIVFDEHGAIRGVAQREFGQHFPQPGWVEHDPEEIWSSQASTITAALIEARVKPRDLSAVAITNQRETTIVWERESGRAICNAIVWQDRRTAPLCEKLRREGREELFRAKTGLLLDPYFSGTKIRWILDNVDGARAKAEAGKLCFGTVDSWLAWKLLSGSRHVTDPSNASRTLLYDIHRGDWDDELLTALDVPRSMMPEVVPSSGVVGEVRTSIGPTGAPLAGIVGDQQGALAGQACFAAGDAKCTYGTGCFLLLNTGGKPRPSANRLLTTVAWKLGDQPLQYALEGSVFIGGAVVQWLRDGLKIIRRSPDVEALAASVPDSGGVVLVPAFAGLGAPYWDAGARGMIHGITRGTTSAHIARAALEAIGFQVAELVHAMERDAGTTLDELRVDGGAAADDLLIQIQADLLQRPVIRPKVLETTALGAAHLAGLATGVWKSTADIASHLDGDRRFEPKATKADIDARTALWTKAVERARNWQS